jgi:hypothetical protein
MQSRKWSFIEAWANIVVGIGIAYVMNFLILRAFDTPISHRQNLIMTALMTVVSLVRSYSLRRFFNRVRH